MGDRGNVAVEQGDGSRVYLYTHWGGTDLPTTLRVALAKRIRWRDPSYLTRIIFDEMKGDDRGEHGFGIATRPPDNEHPILVLDCVEETVTVEDVEGRFASYGCKQLGAKWSFEDYVSEAPLKTWAYEE